MRRGVRHQFSLAEGNDGLTREGSITTFMPPGLLLGLATERNKSSIFGNHQEIGEMGMHQTFDQGDVRLNRLERLSTGPQPSPAAVPLSDLEMRGSGEDGKAVEMYLSDTDGEESDKALAPSLDGSDMDDSINTPRGTDDDQWVHLGSNDRLDSGRMSDEEIEPVVGATVDETINASPRSDTRGRRELFREGLAKGEGFLGSNPVEASAPDRSQRVDADVLGEGEVLAGARPVLSSLSLVQALGAGQVKGKDEDDGALAPEVSTATERGFWDEISSANSLTGTLHNGKAGVVEIDLRPPAVAFRESLLDADPEGDCDVFIMTRPGDTSPTSSQESTPSSSGCAPQQDLTHVPPQTDHLPTIPKTSERILENQNPSVSENRPIVTVEPSHEGVRPVPTDEVCKEDPSKSLLGNRSSLATTQGGPETKISPAQSLSSDLPLVAQEEPEREPKQMEEIALKSDGAAEQLGQPPVEEVVGAQSTEQNTIKTESLKEVSSITERAKVAVMEQEEPVKTTSREMESNHISDEAKDSAASEPVSEAARTAKTDVAPEIPSANSGEHEMGTSESSSQQPLPQHSSKTQDSVSPQAEELITTVQPCVGDQALPAVVEDASGKSGKTLPPKKKYISCLASKNMILKYSLYVVVVSGHRY